MTQLGRDVACNVPSAPSVSTSPLLRTSEVLAGSRHEPWDAPEIDGSAFLNGDTELKPGDIVRARITHADEYDLWAER
jgi:TRAM domain